MRKREKLSSARARLQVGQHFKRHAQLSNYLASDSVFFLGPELSRFDEQACTFFLLQCEPIYFDYKWVSWFVKSTSF